MAALASNLCVAQTDYLRKWVVCSYEHKVKSTLRQQTLFKIFDGLIEQKRTG